MVILLTGCLSEPEPQTFDNINSEVTINLSQHPTAMGPELVFEIESVKLFDCPDAVIQSELIIDSKSVHLEISEVSIPDDCLEGEQPAIGENRIFLEQGTYDMSIALSDLASQNGNLQIASDRFILNLNNELDDGGGISSTQKSIFKIPNGHVWGTIGSENDHLKAIDDLINKSQDFIEISSVLNAGDYGLFQIENANDSRYDHDHESFIIFELKNAQEFKAIIEEIRTEYPSININLVSSTGEEF